MDAKKLIRESIFAIVFTAGLVTLLANLPDSSDDTIGPANIQAVEKAGIGHEAALNPGAESNNDLRTAPVNPVPMAANERTAKPATAPPVVEESLPEGHGPFSISGIVVDEAGKGVYGVDVFASSKNLFMANEDEGLNTPRRERKALTDIEGLYAIHGVNDGEYRIFTQPDDRYEAAEAVVRAGAETADLILRERHPDVDVFGSVRSAGQPLDNVQVLAIGQSSGVVYTDAKGFYELAVKVTPAKPSYTLRFVREGYREKRSVIETQELEGPGQIQADVELEPVQELVEVSGTVHNKKGEPVPGETVQLYSEAARQRYSAVSDRHGAIWFAEVETSADYTASVHPSDTYRDFFIRNMEIAQAGADLEVVLEPLNPGRLIGQMVEPNGLPVPEFSLWLRNPDAVNQPDILVTGDSQGYFEVDQIKEGALIFETRSSPLYSISGIHLSANEEKDVRLVLDWGNNQVTGLVVDDTGQAVAGSELFVTSFRRDGGMRAHVIRKAITDDTGYFLFTQVGPGYHTIRIDVPGFQATILDHDVGMDTPEVIIRLTRASTHGM